MQITITILAFLVGAILLLAALFGGTIVLPKSKLPPLKHPLLRIIAGIVSLPFLLYALLNDQGILARILSPNVPQVSAARLSDSSAAMSQMSTTRHSSDSKNPLSGYWVDDDGIAYEIVQDGESIYWSSDSPDAAKSMRAEGIVHGNTLSLVTETNDNSTGRAELTVNSAHNTIIGMIDDSKHGKISLRLRRR